MHRLDAKLIISRIEHSAVRKDEFFILIAPFVESPEKVNSMSLLACRLVEFKCDAEKRSHERMHLVVLEVPSRQL